MIHLSYDHQRIAALAHSDDALQWLCNGQPLDWQAILSHWETNILVRDDETDSHALFQFKAPAMWEFHFVAPPSVRGKAAASVILAMLEWFDLTIGHKLFAKCHVENRRVFYIMPSVGFRYRESRDGHAYFERA